MPAGFVLASLRPSTYQTTYASALHSLRPRLGETRLGLVDVDGFHGATTIGLVQSDQV